MESLRQVTTASDGLLANLLMNAEPELPKPCPAEISPLDVVLLAADEWDDEFD